LASALSQEAVAKQAVIVAVSLICIARAETLSFDSVSIKRGDPGARIYKFESNRFIASHASLATLISIAYDLPIMGSTRISGGPSWVRVNHFDVVGNVDLPPGTQRAERVTNMKLMLRTMLADRFKLTLRPEIKDLPIYTLTVAKGGPKLESSAMDEKDCADAPPGVCHTVNGGPSFGMHSKAVNMKDIVRAASVFSDRPIVDNTGLEGLYEINTYSWTDTRPLAGANTWDSPAQDLGGPTLIAVFQSLGLKMQATRGPVEIFAIEHAERPSTK
jgi:uncharacterized protein (TIGR03435 family)